MLLPGPHYFCIPDYITEKNYLNILGLMAPEETSSAKSLHDLVAIRDDYISRASVNNVIIILIPVLAERFAEWCESRRYKPSLQAAAYYASWLHMTSRG